DPRDAVVTIRAGAGGIDVLKACRRVYPDTLVILITGFASLETAIQAIREGAYDYITKPFKMEEMRIAVRNASEHIRLIKENKTLIEELQEAYDQIRMVKKIMGAENHEEEDKKDLPEKPLIAGSMLPHSYVESLPGRRPAFLSDLERISTLREKGFLSEEEFEICKSRLLKENKMS
ncbi:MAG: response regulator, partial [Desulfobacteraceae bacterium]